MSEKRTLHPKDSAGRPARVPIHKRNVLTAKQRAGFHRCYVNEVPHNVQAYLDAGYTFVLTDDSTVDQTAATAQVPGNVVRIVANKDPHAPYRYAVLMEIPQEYFDEDMAAQQALIDQNCEALDPRKNTVKGSDFGSIT